MRGPLYPIYSVEAPNSWPTTLASATEGLCFKDPADSIIHNSDATPANDIDIFFNNAGGIRTDWCYDGTAWVSTGCVGGPQLKAVLERAYRNYFFYKYPVLPDYGGYSHYTTCMLDTNKNNVIKYADMYPEWPDGNNVISLTINGTPVDFSDATKFYNVSTVNYLAAGSCNFNDGGVSLWPLNRIVADTQYYVRDAVIDYVKANTPIAPAIEGRLQFSAWLPIFLPVVLN